jgi:hypothetical protein
MIRLPAIESPGGSDDPGAADQVHVKLALPEPENEKP